MRWKAAAIIIYLLLSVFLGFGLVYPGISQVDQNAPIENGPNGDMNRNYYCEDGQADCDTDQRIWDNGLEGRFGGFCWPNVDSINIANINGGDGYINQNVNQNALAERTQSASAKLPSASETGFDNMAFDGKPVGNLYTINFFNINYGSLLGDMTKESPQRSWLQHYPTSMEKVLKELAENANILEKERKENLELLKKIASR